jgi:hypothetical protein
MDQLDEDAPPGLLSEVLYQQVILNNNTRTWLYTQLGYCWESVDIVHAIGQWVESNQFDI